MLTKYINFYRKYLSKFFYGQLIGLFLLTVYAVSNMVYPWFLQKIIDDAILHQDMDKLIYYTLCMLGVIIVSIGFKYLKMVYYFKLGKSISCELKNNLLKDLLSYDFSFFNRYKTGELVSILEQDVATIQTLFINIVNDMFSNLLTFVGLVVIMSFLSLKMTLIALGLIAVYVLLQTRYGKKVKQIAYQISRKRGEFQSLTQETIENIKHIQLLNRSDFFTERYNRELDALYELNYKKTKQSAKISAIDGGFEALNLIVLLFIGGMMVVNQELKVGALFTLTIYVQKVFAPVLSLMSNYMEFKRIQASMDRILEISEHEMYRIPIGELSVEDGDGLAFDRLSFGYSEEKLFEAASIELPPKSKVLFWGENGTGKSTLTKLVMKQLKGGSGSIRLSGVNIETLDKSYWDQVCLVPQNPFIFRGSIRENLLMGEKHQTDDRLYHALRHVNLLEDVQTMEHGLETLIGPNGVSLSGGQAQKLALARVFLNKKCSVLILDEPTSALDLGSEKQVLDQLFALKKDCTILMISHKAENEKYCQARLMISNQKISLEPFGRHSVPKVNSVTA